MTDKAPIKKTLQKPAPSRRSALSLELKHNLAQGDIGGQVKAAQDAAKAEKKAAANKARRERKKQNKETQEEKEERRKEEEKEERMKKEQEEAVARLCNPAAPHTHQARWGGGRPPPPTHTPRGGPHGSGLTRWCCSTRSRRRTSR